MSLEDIRRNLAKNTMELPSGLRINIPTGEVLNNITDRALNELRRERFQPFDRGASTEPMTRPAPASRESGRSIAKRQTLGDPYNEDVTKRPKGNAKTRYIEQYVMKDRIRSANRRAATRGPDVGALPTRGKEYRREVRRLISDFQARYPNMGIDEAQLMHVNPLAQGGKNSWGNLKLGPIGLNVDQMTAHPSAYRQLLGEEAARFGAKGSGLGQYWEGIPDENSSVPEYDPTTRRRKPVGPKGQGLKGLGAFGAVTGPITAIAELIAAKKNNKSYSVDDFLGALLGTGNINQKPQGPMG